MSESKAENLHPSAVSIYTEFVNNESYCGLNSIFKAKKIGSKTSLKIKKILYELYGRDSILSISRNRTAKNAHKNRSKESYHISDTRRKKMVEGIIRYWKNNDDAKLKSKELMIKYCLPKSQTDSSKLKRKESRIGYKHTAETIEIGRAHV